MERIMSLCKITDEVLSRLRELPGIVAVCRLDECRLEELLAIEARHESSGLIPLVNQGMRCLGGRRAVVALLKDHHFREPPGPTVYLVEDMPESEEAPPAHVLALDGKRYRIVGEEVIDPRRTYDEKTVPMSWSFVLFPQRRRRPDVPGYFLVPMLPFPELEDEKERLGIERIVSISPSARTDDRLRGICGFSADPGLATLLVGFDPAS